MVRRRIDASHVIAFQHGGHRYLRDGVVVTDGSEIVHVGPQGSWNHPVDESIDASGMVLTPGFINTHTHLYESPLDKSFVEDMGRRQF
jgi:5-methylthioadenosine/S-adenosylhomocysteine deaminase